MMYGNGDVYEGMWANDVKHGSGTFFYMSRGKRCDGVWAVSEPHTRLVILSAMNSSTAQ